LTGALERFSSFFHSPLFAPSCTSRELNAVDSENKKNLQSDVWRIFQVNKSLSKPGHVWSKFGTGNRESLSRAARLMMPESVDGTAASDRVLSAPASRLPSPSPSEAEADGGAVGREIRRRLMKWWTEEYCASRMNLCVLGKGIN
jgi:insulysin